ncbi:MAG: hypothetical protein JWM32_1581, partial [Verrucomicrobia bacterium]|nr:hypothetical protein [Verrucomicrobiota bacterium]
MIVLQALLMTGVAEADIRTYPLDARSVYTVTVGVGQPTTCVFPGIIKGLVGANVSMKPEDNPGILLSHAEGTEYFSVRPLKENAAGALNVMFKGQVYPFAFVCGSKPDQAVILLEEAVIGSRRTTIDAAALREFLQRAKQDERLRALYPAVETGVQRTTPGTV